MTISTTYAPAQYTGNAVTTAFSFPYSFFDDTDLLVYLDGVLQVSGYTVTGGSGASGTITFSAAPASAVIVTIELSLPYTQLDDYVENQAFPADTLERGLDKAAIRDQQLNNLIFRALKYPATISGITDASLPTPIDGTALVFDGTTGAITTSTTYIADAVSDATAAVTGTALITATSTTSLATTGTGNKTWVIQSGRGFALGQRLRAASDDGTKINEGLVNSYSDTSLIINVDYVSGSGTHADWNISVIGDRGASGAGTGDMVSTQNLNDVASKPTAFNTIKQAATDTNSGVVELATDAETIAGTDTTRAVTPSNIAALGVRIPSGSILDYAGLTEPSGFLFCYGQAISRTTYSTLFTAISTTYGEGDGTSTFNLPDCRGRVVAGKDDMGGTSANRLTGLSGGVNGDTLGGVGGEEAHTLSSAEMPSHSHTVGTGGSSGAGGTVRADPNIYQTTVSSFNSGASGSGGSHNNIQPTIVMNKIIKI